MPFLEIIHVCLLAVSVARRPQNDPQSVIDVHELLQNEATISTQGQAPNGTECSRVIPESSCNIFSCHKSRGPTKCVRKRLRGLCTCKRGFCSKGGACVEDTGDGIFATQECVKNAETWERGNHKMMDANGVRIKADRVWHSLLVLKVATSKAHSGTDSDGFPTEKYIALELQPNAWTHELPASEVDEMISGCGYHEMLHLSKGKPARVVHLVGKPKFDERWVLRPGVTVRHFFRKLDQKHFWDPDNYNCQHFTRDMLRDTGLLDPVLCPEGGCQVDYQNYLDDAVMHHEDLVTSELGNQAVATLIGKMGLHPPCGNKTSTHHVGNTLWDDICGDNPMKEPGWNLHGHKAIGPTRSEVQEVTLFWRDSTKLAKLLTSHLSRTVDWCIRRAALERYSQTQPDGQPTEGTDSQETAGIISQFSRQTGGDG